VQNLSPLLEQSLIFFTYTTTIILVVISVFLVKLLIELSLLAKTSQNVVEMFGKEIEPTISELQTVLKNVNTITSTADEKVEALKHNVNAILEPLRSNVAKFKLGFLKILAQGINTFLKK
jgi:uncharacterized protein YoxC